MKRLNIHQAKTHLSRYAKLVKAGETLILCDRNVPFAELRPLDVALPAKKRVFGLYRGQIKLRKDFNTRDPQLEKAFEESSLFPEP
jgi:antitoxin (DNA-binding transcriptional repressor) of toxin-antitoxin stability system